MMTSLRQLLLEQVPKVVLRMRRFLLVFVLMAFSHSAMSQQAAGGITIVMKDGKSVVTPTLTRNGASVMVTVQLVGGIGQVGYPISSIEKIDFPEPPQLSKARDFLAQGKTNEALGTLAPLLAYYEPYRDIPGNYWPQAATLKLNALTSIGREAEAETLIGQLAQLPGDSEALWMAKAQQAASWTRKGQCDKALAVLDEVISKTTDRETLAVSWLNKGHCLLALRKWEPAALAYLHVPVFYGDRKLLVPQALVGSARALAAMGENAEAESRLNSIIQDYPTSPEATTAKSELEKLKKKQS